MRCFYFQSVNSKPAYSGLYLELGAEMLFFNLSISMLPYTER